MRVKTKKLFNKLNVILFAVMFAGIGMYIIVNSLAATPTSSNLWVDGGSGNCSYDISYHQDTACNNISDAFNKCSGSSSVILANDISGNQSISGAKVSPGCTVEGQDHTVNGNLSISSSTTNTTIQNLTVFTGDQHATNANPKLVSVGGTTIRLNNFKVHGMYSSVYVENANDFQWNGGDLGTPGQSNNKRTCVIPINDLQPMRTAKSTNLVINGVNFYHQDADKTKCVNADGSLNSIDGAHVENIRIDLGTNGMIVKNSFFVDGNGNDTNTIFITNSSSTPDPVNLTFINNYFGTDINPTFMSNLPCTTFKFAYNTFHNTPGAMGESGNSCNNGTNPNGSKKYAGGTWIGNLGPRPAYYYCESTSTYIKNVWQDSSSSSICGTDKRVIGTQFGYENLGLGGADGFHLTSTSSPAYNAGETAYCSSLLSNLDHDGNSRPFPSATNCDAGAHEFGSTGGTPAPPPPPPSKPGNTNPTVDNVVDSTDLTNLLNNYKSTTYTNADFNGDGKVNAYDLSILLSNYGQ